MRDYIQRSESACRERFKQQSKGLEKELAATRSELGRRGSSLSEQQRHDLRCTIQSRRLEQEQARMFAKHAVPLA